MALVNGIYVHVTDESVDRGVTRASHSVETGIDITDTVKPEAIKVSLSGEIVDYDATIISKPPENGSITAWVSMVKKEAGTVYDVMDFSTLSSIIICKYWSNTIFQRRRRSRELYRTAGKEGSAS